MVFYCFVEFFFWEEEEKEIFACKNVQEYSPVFRSCRRDNFRGIRKLLANYIRNVAPMILTYNRASLHTLYISRRMLSLILALFRSGCREVSKEVRILTQCPVLFEQLVELSQSCLTMCSVDRLLPMSDRKQTTWKLAYQVAMCGCQAQIISAVDCNAE